KARHNALQVRELLVEIASKAIQLFRLAEILGCDNLVELRGKSAVVRPARFVGAKMARALRLSGSLRVTKVGVVRGIGSRSLHRLGGGVGHILGRQLRVLPAHSHAFLST